jgi:hypothetical protein
MNVTAVRVEELDQRIIAYDLDLAGRDDPPRATGQASTSPNCQMSGVQPCFRDEICWPRQPWARQ